MQTVCKETRSLFARSLETNARLSKLGAVGVFPLAFIKEALSICEMRKTSRPAQDTDGRCY